MIDLLAPSEVYLPASKVMHFAKLPRKSKKRDDWLRDLYSVMRKDLGLADWQFILEEALVN